MNKSLLVLLWAALSFTLEARAQANPLHMKASARGLVQINFDIPLAQGFASTGEGLVELIWVDPNQGNVEGALPLLMNTHGKFNFQDNQLFLYFENGLILRLDRNNELDSSYSGLPLGNFSTTSTNASNFSSVDSDGKTETLIVDPVIRVLPFKYRGSCYQGLPLVQHPKMLPGSEVPFYFYEGDPGEVMFAFPAVISSDPAEAATWKLSVKDSKRLIQFLDNSNTGKISLNLQCMFDASNPGAAQNTFGVLGLNCSRLTSQCELSSPGGDGLAQFDEAGSWWPSS